MQKFGPPKPPRWSEDEEEGEIEPRIAPILTGTPVTKPVELFRDWSQIGTNLFTDGNGLVLQGHDDSYALITSAGGTEVLGENLSLEAAMSTAETYKACAPEVGPRVIHADAPITFDQVEALQRFGHYPRPDVTRGEADRRIKILIARKAAEKVARNKKQRRR